MRLDPRWVAALPWRPAIWPTLRPFDPPHREDAERDEQHQHHELSYRKGRLGLGRGERVQAGTLRKACTTSTKQLK